MASTKPLAISESPQEGQELRAPSRIAGVLVCRVVNPVPSQSHHSRPGRSTVIYTLYRERNRNSEEFPRMLALGGFKDHQVHILHVHLCGN